MKWSIVGLVVLGLFAACCAAVLFAVLRTPVAARGDQAKPANVQIVRAAKALPPLSVVEADDVETASVPQSEAPSDCYSGPTNVVGRVVTMAMVPGQPFTGNCFSGQSTGANLAAILPKGMRAVSVTLSESSGMESLLYPGSVVDVLISLKKSMPEAGLSEAMSKTLLNNVQVVAIDDRTVHDTSGSPTKDDAPRVTKRRVVTLMVDPSQAEALQLAMEHGTVSLAMRNPQDKVLNPSQLVLLSGLCGDFYTTPKAQTVSKDTPVDPFKAAGTTTAPAAETPKPQWEIMVLRGGATEKKFFAMPD